MKILPELYVDSSLLQAVGRLTVNYSRLEGMLRWFIQVLVTEDRKVGDIVTAQSSVGTLAAMLEALYRHAYPGAVDHDDVKRLLSQLEVVQARRNALIHSSWWLQLPAPADDEDVLEHHRRVMIEGEFKTITTRDRLRPGKGLVTKSDERSADEIEGLAAMAHSLSEDFYLLMVKQRWPEVYQAMQDSD
jgi:hypothetical protein